MAKTHQMRDTYGDQTTGTTWCGRFAALYDDVWKFDSGSLADNDDEPSC